MAKLINLGDEEDFQADRAAEDLAHVGIGFHSPDVSGHWRFIEPKETLESDSPISCIERYGIAEANHC